LSGARRRVGFHAFFGAGPYRGNLMTHRLLYNSHLHTSQTFLMLVEAVLRDPATLPTLNLKLAKTVPEPPKFVPSPRETAQVWELLIGQARGFQPVILLNPNSSDLLPLRRWPTERYVELAKRLLEHCVKSLVVFTGAPEERSAIDDLLREVGSKRCVSLAGRTTIRQLLSLYTLSDVLVTNDSGPAHFATLTSIQIVTLFGPETPQLFAAPTAHNTVVSANLACSPCVNAYNNRRSPCRENVCMQAITVDEVFVAVCRALEAKEREEGVDIMMRRRETNPA